MKDKRLKRDAESSDILFEVLMIGVFIVSLACGVFFISNSMMEKAKQISATISEGTIITDADLISGISKSLETYIVQNPTAAIPETNGLVSYTAYTEGYDHIFSDIKKSYGEQHTAIATTSLDNGNYKVCILEDKVSSTYNSATGKTVINTSCS